MFAYTSLIYILMQFLKIEFQNEQTISQSLDSIANKFGNDIQVRINNAYYRVVDFEFYLYAENFPDPHTYKHSMQLQPGKFYLHASGVDITVGDEQNHGGILLRTVIRLYDGATPEQGFMKQQFDGPQVVATELFSNLNTLTGDEPNIISLVDIEGHNMDSTFYPAKRIIKTKRVGLTPKATDESSFYKDVQLRYITILPRFAAFKQNIKGIEALMDEQVSLGRLTKEEAVEILGYRKTFA